MPNGNDKWSQYEDKGSAGAGGDKWAQYEVKPPAATGDDSILGGFTSRAIETGKGLRELAKPPTSSTETAATILGGPGGTALYRMGKGLYEAGKAKVGQVAQDIGKKEYGKAALHATQLSPTNPLGAFSPSGDIPDKLLEGHWKSALGASAFDALTYLVGGKLGKTGAPKQLAKLTAAVGETGETAEHLRSVLPELNQTVQQVGKPQTIGDLRDVVQRTLDAHEDHFNQALAPLANNMVDTSTVRQRILSLIKRDSPAEEIQAIRAAANEYLQPKTMGWLNDRRGRLNAYTTSLYDKSSADYASAVKSHLPLSIDKETADAIRNLQYDVMDRTYPGQDFADLKRRVGSLWWTKDQLSKRIGDLTDKQATHEAKGALERVKPHVYVNPKYGPRAGFGVGMEEAPKRKVDTYTRQAFRRPSGIRQAAGTAVLAAPLSRLSKADDE